MSDDVGKSDIEICMFSLCMMNYTSHESRGGTHRGILEVMLALRECGLVPYTSMAKVWLSPPSKPGEQDTVRLLADTLYSEQFVGASGLARTSKKEENLMESFGAILVVTVVKTQVLATPITKLQVITIYGAFVKGGNQLFWGYILQ